MKKNVVMGAVHGLPTEKIAPFVLSLKEAGFDGDVILFHIQVDAEFESFCRKTGVRTLPFTFSKLFDGPIHCGRFKAFHQFLQDYRDDYNGALVSDVSDVIFQSNPFKAVDDRLCHFFLECDRVRIGENPSNAKWVRRFVPAAHRDKLYQERISCVGVGFGQAEMMADYLTKLWLLIKSTPLWHRRKIGADQALHNYITYVDGTIAHKLHINNDIVATMGLEGREAYRLRSDGTIEAADGTVPAVCHQYDRYPDIEAAIHARYRLAL